MCGTPQYLAPEQVSGQGHDTTADWWGLGIFIYEMLCGKTPIGEPTDNELQIYAKVSSFKAGSLSFPAQCSADVQAMVNALVQPSAKARADHGKLQSMAWFSGIDWAALQAGTLESPLKDTAAKNFADAEAGKGGLPPLDAEEQAAIDAPYEGDADWYEGF